MEISLDRGNGKEKEALEPTGDGHAPGMERRSGV